MTKLEQKLIELGYTHISYGNYYAKLYNKFWEFQIRIENNEITGLVESTTETDIYIVGQEDIDYFQELFDMLQNDLKILKECEENATN